MIDSSLAVDFWYFLHEMFLVSFPVRSVSCYRVFHHHHPHHHHPEAVPGIFPTSVATAPWSTIKETWLDLSFESFLQTFRVCIIFSAISAATKFMMVYQDVESILCRFWYLDEFEHLIFFNKIGPVNLFCCWIFATKHIPRRVGNGGSQAQ